MGLIDLTGAELAPLSWQTLRERYLGARRGAADDLFCGMGGMAAAAMLAGAEVNFSANHNTKSYLTHSINFSHVEHMLGDLSILDPSRLIGEADILLASPECRRHSRAGNWRQAVAELSPWDPDREAERSRCTMWCPQRLSAYREYEYVILENVVEVTKWNQFHNWLKGWSEPPLDYIVDQVCFNAAFLGAPQSRDRIAFVIRRRGAAAANLDFRPRCYCWYCERQVFGVQRWKEQALRHATAVGPVGKFAQQYMYCCPCCATVACPLIIPARAAVDPRIPAQRIRDRAKPLQPNTMRRLTRGWVHRGEVSQLVTVEGPEPGSKMICPIWLPATSRCAHTAPSETEILVPLRNHGVARATTSEPAQALCAGGQHHAIVGVDQEGAVPRDIDTDPIATLTTGGNHFIVAAAGEQTPAAPASAPDDLFAVQEPAREAMIVPAGYNSDLRNAAAEPAPTQVTTVRASLLEHIDERDCDYAVPPPAYLASYYGSASRIRAVEEPAATQTTRDRHALLTPPSAGAEERADIALADCTFRMLAVKESQGLMDLIVRPDGEPYLTVEIDGITNTDGVRLAGNAVCQTQFANVINRVLWARERVLVAQPNAERWQPIPRRR